MARLTDKVLTINDVDVSKIKYVKNPPKAGESMRATLFNITYSHPPEFSTNLVIQTPEMYTPFGIDSPQLVEDDSNSSGSGGASAAPLKQVISLAFNNLESDPRQREFFDKLGKWDEHFIQEGLAKKFHERVPVISEDIVRSFMYQPLIKTPKKEGYPKFIKAQVPTGIKGEYLFPTYKKDPVTNQPILDMVTNQPRKFNLTHDFENKCRGALITALLHVSMVWVTATKTYGITLRVKSLLVKPAANRPDFAFVNLPLGAAATPAESDLPDGNEIDEE